MPTRRAAPSLTPTPNAAKAPTREALAAALAERERELAEALERQKASAEVLSAISKSVADAAPVFETILDACQRLFGSEEIGVYTIGDDDMVRVAAWRGPRAEEVRGDVTPVGESVTGRIIRERRTHHIPDLAAEPDLSPTVRDRVNRLGGASLLYAPMLSEDRGLGSILVVRSPPKPFAEREKALLQSFADQAAIAIQNSRLFRETQDALQQQTATADVLKIISRSAFDLNQATTTILAAAARLCRAPLATLHLRDGEVCRLVTQFGLPEAFERQAREAPIPVRYPLHSRLPARAGEVAHFPDAWTDPDYLYKATARLGGYRAIVVIPMMREDELVGIFSLGRPEPEPFTPGQIKLVQTFADQAAIAIENARLFNEVKSRTDDLTEALQQQTATADVLKVISRSAFDLQTVFDTLLGSAVALSGADSGVLGVRDGDAFRCRSFVNKSPDLVRFLSENPIAPGPGSIMGRVALSGRIEWIEDTLADSALSMRVVIRRTNDDRALVGVPLLRDARIEGAIVLGRSEPGRFSARSIELVQTFADQAVIAIENVRLFDEVQAKTRDLEDALQQQTATSNVLQVISRSAFDLQAVLTTLAESALELCGASFVTLFMRDGDAMRLRGRIGLHAGNRQVPSGESDPRRARNVHRAGDAERRGRPSDGRTRRSGLQLRRGAAHRQLPRRPRRAPFAQWSGRGGLCSRPARALAVFRAPDRDGARLRRPGAHRGRKRSALQRGPGAHARARRLARRSAQGAGPADPVGEARLPRPAHRRHRPRDQEPAQFRQQFFGAVARTHRRIARDAWKNRASTRPIARRPRN